MRDLGKRIGKVASRAYRSAMVALPNPSLDDSQELLSSMARAVSEVAGYEADGFRSKVSAFMDSMKLDGYRYRYSPSTHTPTIYSSVYACLLKSMLGDIDGMDTDARHQWALYLDGFQSDDGLFRDPAIANSMFEESDWWGGRHLVLHAIGAYAALDRVPRHPFRYLDNFKSPTYLKQWLAQHDWRDPDYETDIDNQVMNIACVLQYERDFRGDTGAAIAVDSILEYLGDRVNPETGLWGKVDLSDAPSLSRAIQFAYHLYAPFFYDRRPIAHGERITDLALLTQNHLGGFGVADNASACEDMDSVDLLCRIGKGTDWKADTVANSLRRALVWMLANQNDDGGFVFRRNEAFSYGHSNMSSRANESAMFPTWFRSLAIVYTTNRLGMSQFRLTRCPGLQF